MPLSVWILLPSTTRAPLGRYLDAPYATLRHADITGRTPEYWREQVREDSGVFLRGSRGPRRDLRRGWYGIFAGILQGDLRQEMSRVCMLMIVSCEGNMR